MPALQTTSPSSCYLLIGWGFAVTRPQAAEAHAAKRPHQRHKPPLTSLLSWGVPLPSSPLSSNPEPPCLLARFLLQRTPFPHTQPRPSITQQSLLCVTASCGCIFFINQPPKPSHPYRTATSWAERASVDPGTHTHQEQWPFTTGHGSGDGPKTPLLRGARDKEQCRLVQWELEMHSRKLPPGPGTYFCAWSEAKV